jgi:hypothetical protein
VNVTCEQCQKKYVVPDERVEGKSSVSIRCKVCSHQTTIKIGAAPAASSPSMPPAPKPPADQQWGEERTRAMPALDLSAQWYAMIGGKQEGPFGARELQEKVTQGAVGLRTYLWNPKMDGWKRASDVPEVSPIFAGVNVSAPPPEPDGMRLSGIRPAIPILTPQAQAPVAAAVEPKPVAQSNLSDLFSDVGAPSQENARPPTAEVPAQKKEPLAPVEDPFAKLSQDDGLAAPAPGEATKFFIAQAGVNKRNPPWKIALFGGLAIGIPLLLVYILSTLKVIPQVTRIENGVEVQENFFSPAGISGVADILSGAKAKKEKEADAKKAELAAAIEAKKKAAQIAAAGIGTGNPIEKKNPPDGTAEVKPPIQNPDLAALYGEQNNVGTKIPKVRKEEGTGGNQVSTGGGLSGDAAMKIIADKSKSFNLCIDQALRRTPNLTAGNVLLVLDVSQSGVVKSAYVLPKKHEGTDWAECFKSTAKRIVFPASDGDSELQVPFKVGVAAQ